MKKNFKRRDFLKKAGIGAAAATTIFTFIIPIGFLTTVPAQAILNMYTQSYIYLSVLISLTFFFLTKRFWHFALRFYTSASS